MCCLRRRDCRPEARWISTFGKDFHVSPFMPMDVGYHWRFGAPGSRLAVHMENTRGGDALFDATLDLTRREITGTSLAGVLLRFPLLHAAGRSRPSTGRRCGCG